MSQALDNLERDASLKTQGAVDEGKRDVQEATSIGGSYLGAAIDTVKVVVLLSILQTIPFVNEHIALYFQSYLPSSITGASGTSSNSEKK